MVKRSSIKHSNAQLTLHSSGEIAIRLMEQSLSVQMFELYSDPVFGNATQLDGQLLSQKAEGAAGIRLYIVTAFLFNAPRQF